MKKFFAALLVLFTAAVFAKEITVFSTGDLHGSVSGKTGYLVSLEPVIEKLRKECKTSPVLIDAGDICKGWGSAEMMMTGGKLAIDFLNHYQYDVFVPGNHEFERGQAFCKELVKSFKGKVLAANFPQSGFDGSCIIERGNVKIGVIGIAHGGTGMVKSSVFNKKCKALDEVTAVKNELAKLKKAGATVFILVRHYGVHTATDALLKNFPEITLVINAHSHVDKIKKAGNVLCVQAFAPEVAVSRLEVENGKVVKSDCKLVKLEKQAQATRFYNENVKSLTEKANKTFRLPDNVSNREELLFETMKKNADADVYLVRTRKRSAASFSKDLSESNLSYLYSYWDKLCVFEIDRELFSQCAGELKKTGTLVFGKDGKTTTVSGKGKLRVAATEQGLFDVRMKKLFSYISKNPASITFCGDKIFYDMLKEFAFSANAKPAAQVAKTAPSVVKNYTQNITLESVKFFFNGKEYSNKLLLKKKGKHAVKCELEIYVQNPEKIVFCNFTKPLMMTKWFLNGKRIDHNGDDIYSNDITGIDGKLFAKGKNILSCEAEVWVGRMPIGHGRPPKAEFSKKSFVFKAVSPEEAKFTKGPVTGYGLTDRLSFSAWTNLPCKVTLDFNGTKMVSKEGFFHQFEVKGLIADTKYSYSMSLDCRGVVKSTEKYTIKTLPAKGKVRFAVLGDSQGKPECWRRIMAEAAKHNPDFLVHVGDLTSEGNQFDYWNRWDFDGVRQYQAQFPRFLAMGNHERNSSLVTRMVCMANGELSQIYSINPDLKLIVLGFNHYGKPNNVKKYCADLNKELENANEKYIFFAGHGPAWSSGKHGNYKHSQSVIKVLEKNKVQAFFSGHDHSYSRSEPGKGTTQIVAASTSSMPYKPLKAHLNPHQKVFFSKMNYVIVDCLEDKAVFTAYGFDLDKNDLPINMHIIDSGEWKPRR